MYKRILIPLDLTERHTEALRHATNIAGAGQIVLLHVIETIPGLGSEEEKPFYDRLERVARKHLEKHAATLAAHKVPCQVEIRLGNRAREIVRYATDTAADLIVLTAPTIDPANPTQGWGSMSWRVSLLAPCPVLLAKG